MHTREDLLAGAERVGPEPGGLVRSYYRHVPTEELRIDPRLLAGAVAEHRAFAEHRPPGGAAVRLLDSDPAGGAAAHTVVHVVTDDMPYLVDSVLAELARARAPVLRLIHPVLAVRRDSAGTLRELLPDVEPGAQPADVSAESWIRAEIDRIDDANRRAEIEHRLQAVLADVRQLVDDSAAMVARARSVADELEQQATPNAPDEPEAPAAVAGLLRWLADGHFTFLGYRPGPPHNRAGLGLLQAERLGARRRHLADEPPVATCSDRLVLTQAGAHSTIDHSAPSFYVGVRTDGGSGQTGGEHQFVGVFRTTALHENVLDIPVIADRVLGVVHRAGFELQSYSGQRMLEVLQTYPRTELFAADADSLYTTVTGVLELSRRRAVRMFCRADPFKRFYSCLVYLPRDRYTTAARLAMQDVLARQLRGTEQDFSVRVGESPLARVHFVVYTEPGTELEPDTPRITDELTEAVRTWDDRFFEQVRRDGSTHAVTPDTALHYAAALPDSYKQDVAAPAALADVARVTALPRTDGLDLHFYTPPDAEPGQRRLTLYLSDAQVTLAQLLPVLSRMDTVVVDERPYRVERPDGVSCWIYDLGLRLDPELADLVGKQDPEQARRRFEEAFVAAWRGRCETDRFNGLVLRAGVNWRQAAVLRAYARYQRQAGLPYSQDYIQDVVLTHHVLAAALVELFETRFDPAMAEVDRAEAYERLLDETTRAVDGITGLDADRILRGLLTLVRATLRTNYFVTDPDGTHRHHLSLKLNPRAVDELPEPRPPYEVFVCSPRVEGVHLRFGPVARGGLRWSDRREDFRTEVLGLVKAQAAKNAVIVPVGAKGGFVVKRAPAPIGDPDADRRALRDEGVACYRMFVSGLLDLTDNLVDGSVVPAAGVVRHDGDDSYLVVAADKGTATFSDIANDVAISYGYWLGDAFASGGSTGYDHKEMGITARGAWISVQRHFAELGIDPRRDRFTCVGIGDMSGDVFGNGLLRSDRVRLLAAFDHRHVFVDPDPDPTVSFAERRRLSGLSGSSWADYDRSLISDGGGVWARGIKSIPVSAPMRQALGIDAGVTELSPPALIAAILRAPADLLWNGGIGTYVKASTESHADVGDKANDPVRVDGDELRVRVIGEGGNLGLTRRGRIEFARAGGKLNTDAIDNSGGVDCSDHEVNIKIMLDRLVAAGRLATAERNPLLAEMTGEVAALVLADNAEQNTALGVSRAQAASLLPVHRRMVAELERDRGLDRELEALPGSAGFDALETAGAGLSAPELSTLAAHVKLALKAELAGSDVPDAEAFRSRLPGYFPTRLADRFGDALASHPLRREIVTTLLVNEVVDRGGMSYAFRLAEEMGASPGDAVRAFAAVTGVFDLPAAWRDIADLPAAVPVEVGDGLRLELRRLLDRASRWLLTHRPQPLAVGAEISRFRPVVAELAPHVPEWLRGPQAEHVASQRQRWTERGVGAGLAGRAAAALDVFGLLDIAEVTELGQRDAGGNESGQHPDTSLVAPLYFAVSAHLDIDRMLWAVSALERGDRWHALARLALRDDLYASLRDITLDVLRTADPGDGVDGAIACWEQANATRLARARATLDELAEAGTLDLATLSVASRNLRGLARV